ncbi:conjugal transfer transcriptional regulator TraJ [Klebsiella michiganensis]|uniref:hypothetical protein n=1 Tax=Klebsiella michiganensis TaxID=1134687 RepID=UPI0007CBB48D|nr:hypothetical protein [Klebsiella michiganensis]SAQ21809.1 conjugal transfer transcriptional regulator TraJ [Klebsiella michiganensis]
MCAKDRSQIAVRRQTESIQNVAEMLNISSSPSFIRNSSGEFIYSSPLFDQIFLTKYDRKSWFSSISVDVGMELIHSELKALTSRNACLVKNVKAEKQIWSVFIECITLNNEVFTKWVFLNEVNSVIDRSGKHGAFSSKMDKYLAKVANMASSEWAVLNLYSVGFTHSTISKITGLEEQTSKNVVHKMRKELNYPDRDYLILSLLHSCSYSKILQNVIEVLRVHC